MRPQPLPRSGPAAVPATATIPSASKSATAGKKDRTPTGPSAPPPLRPLSTGSRIPDCLTTSSAEQVQQLEAMKAMGVTSVRVEANWYWGQPNGPGSFDWGMDDRPSIQQAGLSADLLIDGCPAWAAASGSRACMHSRHPRAFATWAGAVAARYAAKGIESFEIWNEPNLAAFWSPAPDPAAYTADLAAAYAAVKKADPSAIVVSAGLAPANNDGTNYDPRTFLQDMYADGAQGSFDGLGFHPYSYPDSPDTVASWSGWSMMSERARPSGASWRKTVTRERRSGLQSTVLRQAGLTASAKVRRVRI